MSVSLLFEAVAHTSLSGLPCHAVCSYHQKHQSPKGCVCFQHTIPPCALFPSIHYILHLLTFGCIVSAVDNDLMTPSFKLKRPQLQKHYQKQIDEMYKEAKKGM